jgi:hypothetical protein
MAKKEVEVKGKMDVTEVKDGFKEIKEAANNAKEAASKSATGAKKDWMGLYDIFSGPIPRGIKSVVREFKNTQRSVDRTSKSFKALRSTLASLGIPLLVIAITTLIENLEAVTDWLGITSQANRDAKAAQEAHTDAVNEFAAANVASMEIIRDNTLSIEQRQIALDNLSKTIQGIAELNLEEADSIEKINEAYERQQRLEGLNAEIRERTTQLTEKQNELNEVGLPWYITIADKERERMVLEQRRHEFLESNVLPIANELLTLEQQRNQILLDLAEEEKQRKEAREAEAEAAKAAADALREEERRLESLEKLKSDINQREEERRRMLGKTDHEQNLERLKIQEEGELSRARELGASREVLTMIEENFLAQRNELIAEYEDRLNQTEAQRREAEEAKRKADDDKRLAERERYLKEIDKLWEASILNPENDEEARQRELDALAEKYDQQLALAEGNADLMVALRQKNREEVDAINKKYDDKEIADEKAKQKELDDARKFAVDSTMDMLGTIGGLFERGSEAQKRLAVVEVLVNQAKAISSAIAGATAAAAATGPAAPFTLAGYIASMIASVVGGFMQVKNILSEANVDGGGIGQARGVSGPGITPTLTPQNVTATPGSSFRAYVVQSELQGMQNFQSDVSKRVTL